MKRGSRVYREILRGLRGGHISSQNRFDEGTEHLCHDPHMDAVTKQLETTPSRQIWKINFSKVDIFYKMLIKIRVQKNIEISIQKKVPPLSPRVSLSRLLLVESPPKKHNQREKTTKRGIHEVGNLQ